MGAASAGPGPSGAEQAAPQHGASAVPSPAPGSTTTSAQTGGQGTSAVQASPDRTSAESTMGAEGSSTQTTHAPTGSQPGAGASSSSSASAAASATVNLTVPQKTEIRNTIINNNGAPRVTNLNINLGVGVAVPPSVRFAPLPPTIVNIEPAWRGLAYFLYDEQIVIIDPRTRKVVAVLVA